MRKVIIIDNNRIGLFDLDYMGIVKREESIKTVYKLNIREDKVIESKSLVRKLIKVIKRRIKYEGK